MAEGNALQSPATILPLKKMKMEIKRRKKKKEKKKEKKKREKKKTLWRKGTPSRARRQSSP